MGEYGARKDGILRIYTDGGCRGNGKAEGERPGGWGAVLEYGEAEKELHGGEPKTTNNRMELRALIEAMKAVKRPRCAIEVYSDSSYLITCLRDGWYKNWRRNGWKTTKKKPVENRELWEELLSLIEGGGHRLRFYRIQGHMSLDKERKTAEYEALYKDFCSWNKTAFEREEFDHAAAMNLRVDALANLGMDEIEGG